MNNYLDWAKPLELEGNIINRNPGQRVPDRRVPNKQENLKMGNSSSGPGVFENVLGGLQTAGNIWGAYQKMRLAKDTLNFQKNAYNTNLANQTQTYNTALSDRARSRFAQENRSQTEADAYVRKHSI